jgi:hypothetical protein
MVEMKLIVELVVILVGLAIAIFWLYTNWNTVYTQFIDMLKSLVS